MLACFLTCQMGFFILLEILMFQLQLKIAVPPWWAENRRWPLWPSKSLQNPLDKLKTAWSSSWNKACCSWFLKSCFYTPKLHCTDGWVNDHCTKKDTMRSFTILTRAEYFWATRRLFCHISVLLSSAAALKDNTHNLTICVSTLSEMFVEGLFIPCILWSLQLVIRLKLFPGVTQTGGKV